MKKSLILAAMAVLCSGPVLAKTPSHGWATQKSCEEHTKATCVENGNRWRPVPPPSADVETKKEESPGAEQPKVDASVPSAAPAAAGEKKEDTLNINLPSVTTPVSSSAPAGTEGKKEDTSNVATPDAAVPVSSTAPAGTEEKKQDTSNVAASVPSATPAVVPVAPKPEAQQPKKSSKWSWWPFSSHNETEAKKPAPAPVAAPAVSAPPPAPSAAPAASAPPAPSPAVAAQPPAVYPGSQIEAPQPPQTAAEDPKVAARGMVWSSESECRKKTGGGCVSTDCSTRVGGVCEGTKGLVWTYSPAVK